MALGFSQAKSALLSSFSDQHLCLDELYTQQLEYKDKLANLVNQHCPSIMPATYPINDTNYQAVLSQLSQQDPSAWILKPALLNNGVGIEIFKTLAEVSHHFSGSKRYDGKHVLQRYITRPHLLNGHKYTFRMFVVISNFTGAHLYPHGYFNVCKTPYAPNDFNALTAHLTNEHLNPDHIPNNWQIPTSRCPNFDVIFPQMQEIVRQTLCALNTETPELFNPTNKSPAFSLFGYDFILDEKLKLWLLEINHCPCFPIEDEHILQKHLYNDFWQAVVDQFVMPLMTQEKSIQTRIFQPIILF